MRLQKSSLALNVVTPDTENHPGPSPYPVIAQYDTLLRLSRCKKKKKSAGIINLSLSQTKKKVLFLVKRKRKEEKEFSKLAIIH